MDTMDTMDMMGSDAAGAASAATSNDGLYVSPTSFIQTAENRVSSRHLGSLSPGDATAFSIPRASFERL
jgi:hypothetical protein